MYTAFQPMSWWCWHPPKPFRDILKNLEAILPPLSKMPVEKHSHYHRLVPCFRFLILFFNTVMGEKKPLFKAICLPFLCMGRDSGYQNIRCSKEVYRSKKGWNQKPICQSWAQWHWAAAVGLGVWGQLELHSETLSEHKSNHIGGL